MATALKSLYTRTYVEALAASCRAVSRRFDATGFVAAVFGSGWKALELKQRIRRIATMLADFVPGDYPTQLADLVRVAPNHPGFLGLYFPDFVEVFGLDHFDASIPALQHFTALSSSEFAVRPFIVRYDDRMMRVMYDWSAHDNEHVRRLSSEGCRPRLPWGIALQKFKADPAPILPILERLRADPSEYVRRSVANNLNDIAKDHPDLVLDVAKRWVGESAETDQVVKHACRTLLKRGDQRALVLFGHHDAVPVRARLTLSATTISIGEKLHFAIAMRSDEATPARIEYTIDFVKKGGGVSRKVFKIGDEICRRSRRYRSNAITASRTSRPASTTPARIASRFSSTGSNGRSANFTSSHRRRAVRDRYCLPKS